MKKPKKGSKSASSMMRRPKKRLRIPSAPPDVWWRAVIARTRAARAEIGEFIAGVVLPPGPVMVRGRRRKRIVVVDGELEYTSNRSWLSRSP